LATGVKELHIKEDLGLESQEDMLMHKKDRVSFGTNMTLEDESSGNDSCLQTVNKLTLVVDRFHARKLGGKKGEMLDKRPALNVVNRARQKKTKDSSEILHTRCTEDHGSERGSAAVERCKG
jgi:hypothetical protein